MKTNGIYTIAIQDFNGTDTRYKVKPEVYLYIRQLESYINNPDKSNLKKKYPLRFID